jgi:hypothetical protein
MICVTSVTVSSARVKREQPQPRNLSGGLQAIQKRFKICHASS